MTPDDLLGGHDFADGDGQRVTLSPDGTASARS